MKAKKLLIVEDDAALLRGLKDNFLAQGYQVRTAQDGQKALEDMRRDPPDVVLLDLMLPRISGDQVCRAARSSRLRAPIVMLTASANEEDAVRGLESGADDYVTKPFGIRELSARVRLLSRRESVHAPAPETD